MEVGILQIFFVWSELEKNVYTLKVIILQLYNKIFLILVKITKNSILENLKRSCKIIYALTKIAASFFCRLINVKLCDIWLRTELYISNIYLMIGHNNVLFVFKNQSTTFLGHAILFSLSIQIVKFPWISCNASNPFLKDIFKLNSRFFYSMG